MSARDEIARIIQMSCSTKMRPETAVHYANNLIAAGYHKTRSITTRKEVESLGEGAVLVDNCGDVAQRRDGLWCSYETSPMSDHRMAKYLPATLPREGSKP